MSKWLFHQMARIRYGWNYAGQAYNHKCTILELSSLDGRKILVFFQTLKTVFFQRRRILSYPERPRPVHVIYKILLFLGYRATEDPSKFCHLALRWRNAFDGNPYLPDEPVLNDFGKFWPGVKIINLKCNDVSKKKVSEVFQKTFGYSISIDPRKYKGKCVMKSDWNGLHVGRILECPVVEMQDGFVYERLLNNEVGDGLVEDIRVPIFQGAIPFVYLKYRPVDQRLIDRSHSNKKVIIADVKERLSQAEVGAIANFTNELGLDYGEIDVLRDKSDGKIYIVDVNTNPAGPPEPISQTDANTAIIRLAKAFEKTFAS
jgi:hypothetical protein